MAKCGCKRGGAMAMGARKKGGMQEMAGKGGNMHIGARKRGGKYTGVPPRSALKKGGHPQTLGARKRKGAGIFGKVTGMIPGSAKKSAAKSLLKQIVNILPKKVQPTLKACGEAAINQM